MAGLVKNNTINNWFQKLKEWVSNLFRKNNINVTDLKYKSIQDLSDLFFDNNKFIYKPELFEEEIYQQIDTTTGLNILDRLNNIELTNPFANSAVTSIKNFIEKNSVELKENEGDVAGGNRYSILDEGILSTKKQVTPSSGGLFNKSKSDFRVENKTIKRVEPNDKNKFSQSAYDIIKGTIYTMYL